MARALEAGSFLWLTGIEDTFITDRHPVTGRSLDEYELTGHYESWASDLELMAALGVTAVRYGIPWHRVNPARNRWDFTWVDQPLERLLELGIEPVMDLVHYGAPAWIEQAFLHPDYPRYVAEYATRVAERFGPRIRCYTPLNEPRITAWYTGRLGFWPPFQRGWRGFARVLLALCRGTVETERALRSVVPDLLSVHVDAADWYTTNDTALADEAVLRQRIGFLALDLVMGRVDAAHPLRAWLAVYGGPDAKLDGFLERPLRPDLIGINMYPEFSRKVLRRQRGRLKIGMRYGDAGLVETLCRAYYTRYQVPLLVSETATEGSVQRRAGWLRASVGAMGKLRQSGVPVVGYTWWPMFALVSWAYRHGKKPVGAYLKQMGLWDLVEDGERLARVATPLVAAYRAYALAEPSAVGPIGAAAPA